jgi:hypothetical protein
MLSLGKELMCPACEALHENPSAACIQIRHDADGWVIGDLRVWRCVSPVAGDGILAIVTDPECPRLSPVESLILV